MKGWQYYFRIEKVAQDRQNLTKHKYKGEFWIYHFIGNFPGDVDCPVSWNEEAEKMLRKARRLNPLEKGFELFIDLKDNAVSLIPYSQKNPNQRYANPYSRPEWDKIKTYLNHPLQISQSLFLFKFLNSISQHRPRHFFIMFFQKFFFNFQVFLTNLSQRPANCLVN